MSELRCGLVVPFWHEFVVDCTKILFHLFGCVSSFFVGSSYDVDSGSKSGCCTCLADQFDHSVNGIEQHSTARATDMGKQAAFDRIVFRTIRGIVSHPDVHANFIAQLLQIVPEDVLVRGIAYTTAHQQDRSGGEITLLADPTPKPFEAVACELSVAIGVFSARNILANLSETNARIVQPRIDRITPHRGFPSGPANLTVHVM